MQLPGPKDGDFDSICVFSGAIQAAVADLSNGGHVHDLLAPGLLYQVTFKLPPVLTQKWGEMMCQLQPKAVTLIDFDHWLDSRVMAGTWAAPALPPASNASRQRQRTTKEREEKPPVNTQEYSTRLNRVPACSAQGHTHYRTAGNSQNCRQRKEPNWFLTKNVASDACYLAMRAKDVRRKLLALAKTVNHIIIR
jgi:hypothetical protein